jgi:hypothetical protein
MPGGIIPGGTFKPRDEVAWLVGGGNAKAYPFPPCFVAPPSRLHGLGVWVGKGLQGPQRQQGREEGMGLWAPLTLPLSPGRGNPSCASVEPMGKRGGCGVSPHPAPLPKGEGARWGSGSRDWVNGRIATTGWSLVPSPWGEGFTRVRGAQSAQLTFSSLACPHPQAMKPAWGCHKAWGEGAVSCIAPTYKPRDCVTRLEGGTRTKTLRHSA